MDKKKKILIGITAACGVYVWYLYQSPLFAIKAMAEAAEAKDSQKLSSYIDYEALRASIRPQAEAIAADMASGRVPQGADAFSAFARSIGTTMAYQQADQLVNSYVSPQWLDAAFRGQTQVQPSFAFMQNSESVKRAFDNAEYKRTGLSKMLVVLRPDQLNGDTIQLALARSGLDWKLVAVELPVQQIIRTMHTLPPQQQNYHQRYQPQQGYMRAQPNGYPMNGFRPNVKR